MVNAPALPLRVGPAVFNLLPMFSTIPNNDVYFRAGKNGSWEKAEEGMKYIAVSPDGEHVWAINDDSELFMRHVEGVKWIRNEVPARLNQIAVGDNMEVWGVDSDGDTFYLDCNF